MTQWAVNGKDPVGVWCPTHDGFGYQTATVRDLLGSKHGTLTNMTPLTAWTADTGAGGTRAILFGNLSNERLIVPAAASSISTGSLSVWVKKTVATAADHDYVIWSNVKSSSERIFLEVETYTTGVSDPQFTGSHGTNSPFFTDYPLYVLNEWRHLVFTWSNGTPLKIYVNGALAATSAVNFTTYTTATTEEIGNYPSASAGFGGLIDDVRRFNVVLDASDTTWLFNSGNGRARLNTALQTKNNALPGMSF